VAALLFQWIGVGHGVAAFDAACRSEDAAGMQQGFEKGCFAGAGVACEGHVADVVGGVGHVPSSWGGLEAVMAVRHAPIHGGRPGLVPRAVMAEATPSRLARARARCVAQARTPARARPANGPAAT